jgi:hypothetical protein
MDFIVLSGKSINRVSANTLDKAISGFQFAPEDNLSGFFLVFEQSNEKAGIINAVIRGMLAVSQYLDNYNKLAVRDILYQLLIENKALSANLTSVQTRCTELLTQARAMRKNIISLGGDDPGNP